MKLHELTEQIAGKKEGRLVLLASRPTMGKTSVAMGMAMELAKQGKKVNFISCTEKPAFINQHLEFINRGALDEAVRNNILTPQPKAFTISDIEALCDNKPDAVFVDALQELNNTFASFIKLQVAFKELATKLGCPVIVLSQLPSEIDTRKFHKPRVKDLETADISEYLYDEVLLFYRKSHYDVKADKKDCLVVCKDREIQLSWSEGINCIE